MKGELRTAAEVLRTGVRVALQYSGDAVVYVGARTIGEAVEEQERH